jgi:hypothetical protein
MRPEQHIDEPPDPDEYDLGADPGADQHEIRTDYNILTDQRAHYDSDTRRREYDFDHKTGRIAKLMKKRARRFRSESVLDSGAYGSTRQNTLPGRVQG